MAYLLFSTEAEALAYAAGVGSDATPIASGSGYALPIPADDGRFLRGNGGVVIEQLKPAAAPPTTGPEADWATFKATVLHSPTVNATLAAALAGAAPVAGMALAPALDKAISGFVGEFAACWAALVAAVPVPPEELEGLAAMAEACHLPAEFVEALSPAGPPPPGIIRARDDQGRFVADDPATPENEAWEPAE